jgi:hypothetical protein
MQMVDEMKLLLVPEPGEARELRCLHMVFLVEIDVRIERRCACGGRHQEKTEWEDTECNPCHQNGGDQEIWGIVAFVAAICGRHKAAFGIVPVVKPDVVSEEDAAQPAMAKAVVEQGLSSGRYQMSTDGR